MTRVVQSSRLKLQILKLVQYISQFLTQKMEKSGLNIMVFDEESSFMTQKSRNNHQHSRKPPTYQNLQQSEQVISSELQMLNQKLISLQQKTSRLQQSVKITNYPTSASEISASTSNLQNNPHNLNAGQVDQLLRVIQQKIQIIVKETNKILEKLTNDFDKKLSQVNSQKNHETRSITKIQNHYQQVMGEMEKKYQMQVESIRKSHGDLERKMLVQVEEIQKQFLNKKREFQSKEQEYVRTIQLLESKLRIAHKNKKILEVTQEKRQNAIKCNILDNVSGNNKQYVPEMGGLPPHDTSKRRHRIFDGRSSNRSVSPNSQILSPLNEGKNNKNKNTQSVAKNGNQTKQDQMPQTYVSKDDRFQASRAESKKINAVPIPDNPNRSQASQHMMTQNSEYSQPQYNNYMNLNYSQKPYSVVSIEGVNSQINYESRARASTQNYQQHQQSASNNFMESQVTNRTSEKEEIRSPIQQAKRQQEFRSQTPKGQWQRFQDFNDNESSGSQQDVFFYPEHLRNQRQEPQVVFEYGDKSAEKLFSPFDIN